MTDLVETLHAGGFIISEARGHRSRDSGALISGQNLGAGTVLGKIALGAASSAAKSGGNTGGGALTLDATTPILANAQAGIYTARCIVAATNGGTFEVKDPQGVVIGQCVVGATFADQLKFVIADGSPDFAVGDGFDITIAAGSGKYTVLAPAALDGSQNAAALLYAETDATSGDQACAVISRAMEANSNEITWPAGITTPQKNVATAQLHALGIILR